MRIATYNCQGINALTKREAIKEWAGKRKIDIIALTETKLRNQAREGGPDTEYTTFFASEPKEHSTTQAGIKAEQAGVGLMIKSTLLPSVLHVEQHGSRIMSMRIKTQPPTRIIVAYMPQAFGATWEQKSGYYDKLNEVMDTCPRSEPLYILGDFNARLQCRPKDEEEFIGPWVYGRGEQHARDTCVRTMENRELFLAWVAGNRLHLANTWFQKPDKQLITFREVGTDPHTPTTDTSKYNQLDYILCRHPFKNSILNVQSDMSMWQHSNHYPLSAHIHVRLKHHEITPQGKINLEDQEALDGFEEHMNIWAEDLQNHGVTPSYADVAEHMSTLRLGLPRRQNTMWKPYLTENTKTLIQQRDEAAEQLRISPEPTDEETANHHRLKNLVKKHARMDRQKRSEDWIGAHHSTRDQWKGVAAIRNPYKPRTYELNDVDGQPVPLRQQAAAMATYLETRHWKPNDQEEALTASISTTRLNKHPPNYHIPQIDAAYLKILLKEFHAHKAPGPDYLEADLFKNLPDNVLIILAVHLADWVRTGELDTEELKARVAAIFKKGEFREAENYRPISLLNTVYKLKARIAKDILEQGINKELQDTQYAFRKNRSTLQPIHCIRRLMDKAERAGESLGIVLLDWEKAFDEITHEALS